MKKTTTMLMITAVFAAALFSGLVYAEDSVKATATEQTTTTTLPGATTTTLRAVVTMNAGCSDTDGGKVYNVKGVTNGNNGRYNDKCINPNTLKEYYCDSGMVKSVVVRCDKGCQAAECRSPTGTELGQLGTQSTTATTATTTTTMALQTVTTTTLPKCADSDGGKNYYYKGTAKGVNGEFQDSCSTKGRVREFYCNMDNVYSELYRCKEGCMAGACKPPIPVDYTLMLNSSIQTTTEAAATTTTMAAVTTTTMPKVTTTTLKASVSSGSCSDTDDGRNYGLKGVTIGSNGRKEDRCKSPALLEEYFCDGGLAKVDLHACLKGCSAGICREAVGTGVTTTTLSAVTTTTTLGQ